MEPVRKIRFVDALAEWGEHEAKGRLRDRKILMNGPLDAVEVALRMRAKIVWRLLQDKATESCVFRFDATIIKRLLFDYTHRWSLEQWLARINNQDDPSSRHHYRKLAEANEQIKPPLLFYFDGLNVVVVDGFNRTAAWIAHHKRGFDYPIEANVVMRSPREIARNLLSVSASTSQ